MKTLVLNLTLFFSLSVAAQESFNPDAYRLPAMGYEHLRKDNSNIIRLTRDTAGSSEWHFTQRLTREKAPNANYTGKDIISSWDSTAWLDVQTISDNFTINGQEQILNVVRVRRLDYPGFQRHEKSKYSMQYDGQNRMEIISFWDAPDPNSENYNMQWMSFIQYNTQGQRIKDSSVFASTLEPTRVDHYYYDGQGNLTSHYVLSGTDTTQKTYLTYHGNKIKTLVGYMVNPSSDEWSLYTCDSMTYNSADLVSQRLHYNYTFMGGTLMFGPYTIEDYTYTSSGKVSEIITRNWDGSEWIKSLKMVLNYPTPDQPIDGYAYQPDGTGGWENEPYMKYVFNTPTGFTNTSGKSQQFNVYPNPASQFLILDATTPPQKLVLYDMQGKICLTESDITNGKLYISDLKNGLYMLHLESGNKQETHKILIQH